MMRKERNWTWFKNEEQANQTLKYTILSNLLMWVRLYIEEDLMFLIDLLTVGFLLREGVIFRALSF